MIVVALIVAVSLLVLAGVQAWVTVQVWRSPDFTTPQKWMQTILVWALPILGMCIVYAVVKHEPLPQRSEEEPDDDVMGEEAPEEAGSGEVGHAGSSEGD